MAWHLFAVKQLPEQMISYCQLDPQEEQSLVTSESKSNSKLNVY